MLRNSEGESEILLGNKQLLGIFFVMVILLGVAFAGGYKVGQGSKKATAAVTTTATEEPAGGTAAASPAGSGGETHALPAEGSGNAGSGAVDQSGAGAPPEPVGSATAADVPTAAHTKSDAPLGSRKGEKNSKVVAERDLEASGPPPTAVSAPGFAPQAGQTFLQVAAVTPDEAEAIADVLRKKGFHAHAVPKPGATKIFRVIIGPVRDASDLNSTRASLRNTGFREIFVQRY